MTAGGAYAFSVSDSQVTKEFFQAFIFIFISQRVFIMNQQKKGKGQKKFFTDNISELRIHSKHLRMVKTI